MDKIAIAAQHLDSPHAPLQYCIFDEHGGTIGCDPANTFCLQDSQMQERHISIQYEEGSFTIASINDSEIFYNESFSKLHIGYETTMELGDTFRAGQYTFHIMDPKDIQEDFVDNKKIINEVTPYDKLDTLEIRPRGQMGGLHLNEEKIEDIFTGNKEFTDFVHIPKDLPLSLADTHKRRETPSFSQVHFAPLHKEAAHNASTPQYITALLHNILQAFPTSNLSLDTILANSKATPLSHQRLQASLNETLLVDSIPLLNTIVLAIIVKEFASPLYEALDHNPLEFVLDYAITQSMQGNMEELQILLVKALKNYLKIPN